MWRVFLLEPYPICKIHPPVSDALSLSHDVPNVQSIIFSFKLGSSKQSSMEVWDMSHLGHNSLSLETSADAVVDTLGLSPALTNAHEAVRLVTLEVRSAYMKNMLSATTVLLAQFSSGQGARWCCRPGLSPLVACSCLRPPGADV